MAHSDMAHSAGTSDPSGFATSKISDDAWIPVSLPYAKHPDSFPTFVPSVQDIRQSTAIIDQRTGQTIVAVTPEVLVKYGQSTTQREGQTLLYLEQCVPNFPAPRLYAMYYDGDDFFVVMQRIPGRSLDTLWDELSEQDKDSLTARLRTVFEDMRRVSCPQAGYFGAVDGGPVAYHLFYSRPVERNISGPFSSEQAFNAGLIQQYKKITDSNERSRAKYDFYAAYLGRVFHDHRTVFTHSDLQRKNIIIANSAGLERDKTHSCEIYIVDWEDAGWYPEYWEYAVAFSAFRWDDDWCTRFAEFLPAWPAESTMLKMLYADLFL